jgi:hypothetical protein
MTYSVHSKEKEQVCQVYIAKILPSLGKEKNEIRRGASNEEFYAGSVAHRLPVGLSKAGKIFFHLEPWSQHTLPSPSLRSK